MLVLFSWMTCRIIYTVTSVLRCQAISEINVNLEPEIQALFQCHILISSTMNLRLNHPCYLAMLWTNLFLIASERKAPRSHHVSDIQWNPFSWKLLIGMIHQLNGNSCPCCCFSCHYFYKHVCIVYVLKIHVCFLL